ncbi:MAG: UDP-glucose 4-epimerase GalE [Acetobacteraceae bacterium]
MSNSSRNILVTGGAGYIGSHTAKALAQAGFTPVTYDSLVLGHRWAVQWGPLVEGDIGDRAMLQETLRRYDIAAAVHFAAFTDVGESMRAPGKYFDNNVTKSLVLLDALCEAGVRHVVFSSSCATYGTPETVPITEDTPQRPANAYGETKLIFERALRWYAAPHGLTWTALRYFNAAGADADCEIGEDHTPETHLIPLVLDAALGRRTVAVFGDDYPTRDGTCVRDYIHVTDLADAHVRAVQRLLDGVGSLALNLGSGTGYTVREVIDAVQRVTGRTVPHRIAPRRDGDVPALVANSSLAQSALGWVPRHSSLETIIATAWRWHTRNA